MFMVEQMKPTEKLVQFEIKRGWFWRLIRFLNSKFDREPISCNHD